MSPTGVPGRRVGGVLNLTWNGKRSKPDCKSARKALRPGRYVATAQLAGAEPVELRMIVEE